MRIPHPYANLDTVSVDQILTGLESFARTPVCRAIISMFEYKAALATERCCAVGDQDANYATYRGERLAYLDATVVVDAVRKELTAGARRTTRGGMNATA